MGKQNVQAEKVYYQGARDNLTGGREGIISNS